MSKIKLSQCMIVKNEEKNIERALTWAKNIACEQIVVDTGSTDRTVELAEKLGARVLYFQWIDDFAAAKNHALEQAIGDWILFADADEYFSEEDAEKILPLLEQMHGEGDIDAIKTAWVHLQDDGSVMAISSQERIFRNDSALRYRYRIHEELHRSDRRSSGRYDAQDELRLMHTGYGNQAAGQGEKGLRNARMLEQDLREEPKNAMRLMYLGDAYNSIGDRRQEALDCYRRVLWDSDMNVKYPVVTQRAGLQIMSILQDEPPETTEEEFFKIRDTLISTGCDEHPDLDYYLGIWHVRAGRNENAAELFESALHKMEQYKGSDVVRMISRLELPNWVIAYVAFMKKELQKAVQFAVAAIQADKYCPEALQVLIRAFRTEYRSGMNAEPYWDFLCGLYDRALLKDMYLIYRFAAEASFDELAELAYQQLPEEARVQLGI